MLWLLAWDSAFLSRLCGGELADTYDYKDVNFLSRLCGGEHLRGAPLIQR